VISRGADLSSDILLEPVKKHAIRSWYSISSMKSSTFSIDWSCTAKRNGKAIPAALAPNAINLAISNPVLTPPDQIIAPSKFLLARIVLTAVGIPQSQKISPAFLYFNKLVRIDSTPDQDVPPAP